jgi:hypothetical protein
VRVGRILLPVEITYASFSYLIYLIVKESVKIVKKRDTLYCGMAGLESEKRSGRVITVMLGGNKGFCKF